ncbi:MAG: hypothetical protein LBJ46_03620 [Planctomycetota bacterium]|jgi:beta-phosphoglucomutase-like phosphatase (HAD superfamily)|nr:hypothetical protein [Planctomycetota bacterium]
MGGYLDQIPKQLAARRKASKAVRANPALLSSYWAILRTIANNAFEYMRNAVISGCSFPDRPIYLSSDDASFINFGTTPGLLRLDHAWIEAEASGGGPPAEEGTELTPDRERTRRSQLAGAARVFGRSHAAARVYNLEPWLQEMYRDCLDVDYAEDLQRQIDRLNAYMDGVPKALKASGLTGKLARGVMDSFNLFRTITGSAHQLERDKMSFTDRRNFVNTTQQIEKILEKADRALGATATGRSAVRELFDFWKNANYEMMKYTRELRTLWAGTSLDDRIMDLAGLLGAVQGSLTRSAEDAPKPQPQMPIFAADESGSGLAYDDVVDAFQSVMLQDIVLGMEASLSRNEMRRYGPLSVIIAPGAGDPRYCLEIRRLAVADQDDGKGRTKSFAVREREMEVDRRVRYPINCIVVPSRTSRDTLLEGIADAWLEFNQAAYPVNFKTALDEVRRIIPASFEPPGGVSVQDLSPHHARKTLAGLVARFVRWMRSGTEPDPEKSPDFGAFRDWALGRLGSPAFLVPLRYRPVLELFGEATSKRRTTMWRWYLGPRYTLDRQLLAVNMLQKDWAAFRDHLKYLSPGLVRGNVSLESAFAKLEDKADPISEHKALAFLQRFFNDDPDLKTALVTVESQVSIEMETLRTQAETLGRAFQYDQVSQAMLRRQASQIQEKRSGADDHIDQHLTGLMHALDGNYDAAVVAFSMCLTPIEKRHGDDRPPDPVRGEIGDDWFAANLRPLDGPFARRLVPGEDGLGTVCYDFVYFNLGKAYLKLGRDIEARMCFRGFLESAPRDKYFLFHRWAGELSGAAKARQTAEQAK